MVLEERCSLCTVPLHMTIKQLDLEFKYIYIIQNSSENLNWILTALTLVIWEQLEVFDEDNAVDSVISLT